MNNEMVVIKKNLWPANRPPSSSSNSAWWVQSTRVLSHLRKNLKTGSGDRLNSNVIDGRDYRQRTNSLTNVMDVISGGYLNGLRGANVQLASSPSINGNLHKQPIELSPLLFPFYHRPCSCNKLHTTSIVANQSFSAIFLKPSSLSGATRGAVLFYRKRRKQPCRKKTWDFQ